MTDPAGEPSGSFLADIAAAERRTPLPPAPPPDPDPAEPRYAADPQVLARDRKAAAESRAAFTAAATARGTALHGVTAGWLRAAPLAMLQELLDSPSAELPIFAPSFGPVVVARHEHVLTCLTRTDVFTVAPYAPKMTRITDDRPPGAFRHFLLGTDDDALYRPDDLLLRAVVNAGDADRLTTTTRGEAERWARRLGDVGELDVVPTLATTVPMRIVADYLGVPWQEPDGRPVLPDQRSDGTFSIPDELRAVYTFARIDGGIVPSADRLLTWIRDVFRHVFNNFDPGRPDHDGAEARGTTAIEYLTAYVHALLVRAKTAISAGRPVPDTMLTRLLRLQRQVAVEGDGRLRDTLGPGLPAGQAAARLSDSMIRSNVLGTVVGGVVNPQEATCRIVDSLLRLRAGEYPVRHGSDYATAVRAARTDPGAPDYGESLDTVRGYALEALRLHPQGEVLLRRCVQDTELGGVRVPAGALVFVGYAGAMRDPAAVPQPLAFDITRDQHPFGYLRDGDRAREEPQSRLYLQHGFARHTCLGRYASEITLRESARALLRLGDLQRRSELELGADQLYPRRLLVALA